MTFLADIVSNLINILSFLIIIALVLLILGGALCWLFYREKVQKTLSVLKGKNTIALSMLGVGIAILQAQIVSQQVKIEENQAISGIVSSIKFNEPLSIQFAISRLSAHRANGYKVILSLSDIEDVNIKATILSKAITLALRDAWPNRTKTELFKRSASFFEKLYFADFIQSDYQATKETTEFAENFVHLFADALKREPKKFNLQVDKSKFLKTFLNYEFMRNCLHTSREVLTAINFDELIKRNTKRRVLKTYGDEKIIDMDLVSEEFLDKMLDKYHRMLSIEMSRNLILLRTKEAIADMNAVIAYLTGNHSRKFYVESGQIDTDYYGYLFLIYKPQHLSEKIFMMDQKYFNDFLANISSPLRPYFEIKIRNK